MSHPTKTEMVIAFHEKFGFSTNAPLDDADILAKRKMILDEEIKELYEALYTGDRAHILKELCDVLYATIGMGVCYNLPIDDGFKRVHDSNMSKSPTAIVDGKAIKGEGYIPAQLDDLFAA